MGLCQTWVTLLALSVGSTGLAALVSDGRGGQASMAAILFLAWIKAHLILKTYLDLHRVPQLLRGFDLALGFAMICMLCLALAG